MSGGGRVQRTVSLAPEKSVEIVGTGDITCEGADINAVGRGIQQSYIVLRLNYHT